MIRVLFVDDDALILAGLKRTMRRLRGDWQMEFAGSGEEALQRLARQPFDAVVSDMRMPGMDGAELLTQVKDHFPRIARIILSGQSSQEAMLRTLGPAHQYLSKPCNPQALRCAISDAFLLRDRLDNPALESLVTGATHLPSLPHLFQELVEELHAPGSSVDRVCEIISRDVAMTAKVLRLVNSSFFGLRQHVSSPSHAVCLLGMELVKALVLTVGLFSQCEHLNSPVFSLEYLTSHSLEVATLASRMSRSYGAPQKDCDDALLAGMLHDVGKLILAMELADRYDAVIQEASDCDSVLWQVERDQLGVTHAEIGAYLLGLWGLPNRIVEAVAFHHEPSVFGKAEFGPLAAVHIADSILQHRDSASIDKSNPHLDDSFVKAASIEQQVELWQEESHAAPV